MKFKKGDKVKIIGNDKQGTNSIYHSHKIGEIGIITTVEPYAVSVTVRRKSQWVEYEDVKKISSKHLSNNSDNQTRI